LQWQTAPQGLGGRSSAGLERRPHGIHAATLHTVNVLLIENAFEAVTIQDSDDGSFEVHFQNPMPSCSINSQTKSHLDLALGVLADRTHITSSALCPFWPRRKLALNDAVDQHIGPLLGVVHLVVTDQHVEAFR
jgi:hypothetical protein